MLIYHTLLHIHPNPYHHLSHLCTFSISICLQKWEHRSAFLLLWWGLCVPGVKLR